MSALAALTPVLASTGDRVQDGSLLIALVIAALAGVVSFLSPCVLPLVPAYLSYVTGMSAEELGERSADRIDRQVEDGDRGGSGVDTLVRTAHPLRQVMLGTLGFVAGVSVVFVSFGAVFGSFGDALQEHTDVLVRVFGVVTIAFGLLLAGAFSRINLFNRELRIHRLPKGGMLAAPVLGITFALGWTPCIGPTLGVVLGLAASNEQASALRGAVLTFAYCLGLGLPLLVTGLAFNKAMRALSIVKRHYQGIMVGSGSVLVVLGLLQVTGRWTELMNEVQSRFGGMQLPL